MRTCTKGAQLSSKMARVCFPHTPEKYIFVLKNLKGTGGQPKRGRVHFLSMGKQKRGVEAFFFKSSMGPIVFPQEIYVKKITFSRGPPPSPVRFHLCSLSQSDISFWDGEKSLLISVAANNDLRFMTR